jgi:hypothetical protein
MIAYNWTLVVIQPTTINRTNVDIVHNAEFPDRPCNPSNPLYTGYRVMLEGKAAGSWC